MRDADLLPVRLEPRSGFDQITKSKTVAPQKVPSCMTMASRIEMTSGGESSAIAMPVNADKQIGDEPQKRPRDRDQRTGDERQERAASRRRTVGT